jgi:iron complex outermembrane receptor protein
MNRHSRSTHTASTWHPARSPFRRNTLLLAIACCSLHVQAQTGTGVEEIVVTADFRQARLDNIPASIIVLDSSLIQQKNALHLEDVLLNAPNVNFASGASRARFIQMRGIGETGQFAEPLNSSIGMLIDGVDFSGIGAAAMLYDIEQVEILQGPQGTRYGSNALAGLINLQSKRPTETFETGLQMQAENYDGHGLAAYVSGPLGENLGFRLSGQGLRSDGFSNNTFLQRPTNTRDEQTLRANLVWQATPELEIDTRAGVVDINNDYDGFSLDNIRDTQSDQPGRDEQLSRYASVKATSTALDAFTVEALASVANSELAYSYDEDWVYAGFHPDEYSSTDSYMREHDTRSAELRLLSAPDAALFAGRTSWVAGIYTLDQEVDLTRVYTYAPGDFHSAYAMHRRAVYADTTTTLTERLSFDAGLRAERFSASYDDSNLLHFSPDEDLFGGKLTLNYRTANDNLLYVSASRGYKTGGFNTEGSLDADLREYGSESLWNYEAGFKGSLFDDRLQARLAVFYMDRDDVQVQSSTLRMRANGSTEFIEFTGNAAAGFNRGAELGAEFALNDSAQLYTTLGLLDSEYEDFINSNGDDLDGREQAHAPSYQYTVGGRFQLIPSLLLDVNLQGRDAFYFSDSHDVRSTAYDLLNASLTWTQNQWQLTLWGRNLTDEDYFVRGFYFGNDPRDGYTSKGYTQLGEPLRYGLTLNFDF